ncbi:hypothetical protein A2419_03430 [Candidatus Adlerbacteria bacterium RIFOXYC1_FULL_48_26]|uniref:DUF475 domain-containing protein n=1 Tax=Candidatus Adlerbacteria bacterium RIFOXYC1_FULL_48_26 TaxID=1797247 RepID=A0A1F4Y4J7_9BACT|nr:MAG: hypothetical protein A2419_03430 [Candidatus Adlerbacteria bacterium RIFOXYC1_FULL_48_26]OGC94358.1 MAG: hypothetical protein A2389_01220 [Candidatus Adlerbacteria bacterium RIFOXYB1_FULL_48_10]
MLKFFIGPVLVTTIALGAAYYWGGLATFGLVVFLAVLEISLSFDNAVVNAKALVRMETKWRRRFLTWGMFAAVFGARLVFPVLFVSFALDLAPLKVIFLSFMNPAEYSHLVESAAPVIQALGGSFLGMVALKYFFDEAKRVHWIHIVEKRLASWGRVQAIEVGIILSILLVCTWIVPEHGAEILGAGAIGIVLFILMEGMVDLLGASAARGAKQGFVLFMYLNLIDAAFSFDGVIGAFTLTTDILAIVVGLGIGAYFVRTFTLVLVERKTLTSLVYLEHGAYWAIAALSICMFTTLFYNVPEAIAGTVSAVFIGASYLSSLRHNKANRHHLTSSEA